MTPDTAALRRDHYDYDADNYCDDCGERHPCTVRALCDAADEVERLRRSHGRQCSHKACDQEVYGLRRYLTAARTAHAALVADLRALHFDDCGVCPVCTDDMLESVPFPCPTADALDAACAEVDGTAMEVERLLAAHEAEVRAKVAAEIEAEARQVLTDDGAGQFERAGLLLAARIANPTTTEAAFTATCVPAGCSCDCHRWPGVSHLVACCSQPPFALANPTTTEADA